MNKWFQCHLSIKWTNGTEAGALTDVSIDMSVEIEGEGMGMGHSAHAWAIFSDTPANECGH